ncbi:MAG: antibiotic biosynthesis monooxygenase [Calditrichae bacterium]|nr:antibiotic biosynthesis monooxygenase [Calditrichia bacterium]
MRFVQIRVDQKYISDIERIYEEKVLSQLQDIPGCVFAGLIQSAPDPQDFISLTMWTDPKKAQEYENTGPYKQIMEEVSNYLAEGSEYKIQLSKDLELEYAPVHEEPEVKQLSVTAQANKQQWSEEQGIKEMHIRIVSLSIAKDKLKEFRRLYIKEIMPALKETKGCRHVFLTESQQTENQVLSITAWESAWHAEKYEKSGQFNKLLDKISHTMSDLYKYKMAFEQKEGRHSISKDDMTVSHYEMISGKSFD